MSWDSVGRKVERDVLKIVGLAAVACAATGALVGIILDHLIHRHRNA